MSVSLTPHFTPPFPGGLIMTGNFFHRALRTREFYIGRIGSKISLIELGGEDNAAANQQERNGPLRTCGDKSLLLSR